MRRAARVDRTRDEVTNNALLESTLLHVRSLIDFLTDGGRRTDIRASTFGSQWTLTAAERTELAAQKDLLDKHLAHITDTRAKDGKQHWPYVDIVREVVELMRRFHAGLPTGSPAETSLGDTLQVIDQQAPRMSSPSPAGIATLVHSTTSPPTVVRSSSIDRLRLKRF